MGEPVELTCETVDYHTAGEPFRIVTVGVPDIPGDTVLARRETAAGSDEIDRVRRLLCHEPRGHSDMYGCFVVPPDDDGADLGVLFWHKDGYSTACGHGTIALGAWLVESGRKPAAADGDTDVVIDVPSGRVTARVRCRAGQVEHVTFRNVASYVVERSAPVTTSRGEVSADMSYGGAIYASVPAAAVGLEVTPEHLPELITLGREIKWALNDRAIHSEDARLSGVYGTIWYDDLGDTESGPHQRNCTVFADGEVDRSPCGSGTSARLALLHADGRLSAGRSLTHDSIISTRFTGAVVEVVEAAGRPAVITEVTGTAYRTGEHRFALDPRDRLDTGFLLR
ncbi:MAG TPA: proline racemase family protein [Jiangellaceae bacterium]|nr:proline racemase family protein [Jiangellaceae bacterium]